MASSSMSTSDTHDALHLDASAFAPLLSKVIDIAPSHITVPNALQAKDFADMEFGNTFLDHFDDTLNALKYGFDDLKPKGHLNKDQWFHATAETMVAIHRSLSTTLPFDNISAFLSSLGPDEESATSMFARAVGALNLFCTSLPEGPWQQCAGCLQVNNTLVTPETWEATLQMCNQHVDATRMTILNATIKDFCLKANNWHDRLRATMQDQLILQIVNEEPPPY